MSPAQEVEIALEYYERVTAPRIANPEILCSPREYYLKALAEEVKRLRALESQEEYVCSSCKKKFRGEVSGVLLYTGVIDEGPYCAACAGMLQASEDRIIGK